jgi:hypothetical protein
VAKECLSREKPFPLDPTTEGEKNLLTDIFDSYIGWYDFRGKAGRENPRGRRWRNREPK